MYSIEKFTTNRKKDPLSPWITKGLLKSINKKNKLYKYYLQSPTSEKLQKFKTYKNKLNMHAHTQIKANVFSSRNLKNPK